MEPWHSAITTSDEEHIWIRGYDLTRLMTQASYADVVFLLHQGKLPTAAVQRLINAILIAGADHGSNSPSAMAARTIATGNRRGIEAAIAGGLLAIGDAHGGAGLDCMEMITHGLALAEKENISIQEAASRIVSEMKKTGRRLPGMGHRSHSEDPRTPVLFRLAEEAGVSGDGIAFMNALADAAQDQIKALPINVDGAIAAVLYDLGFPPAFAKAIFIIARTAGLSAQVMEEYTREKPMRIKVEVEYDGPKLVNNGERNR